VLTGAQYHYHRPFVESYKLVQEGIIGKIVNGYVYYNVGNEQHIKRQPEWTDTEYMIRSFFNWSCINGDQVSNLLIHWLDIFVWFSHLKPVQVIAYGSRIRRTVGNIYDNFGMHFDFEGGVQAFGMVRRMDGCDNGTGAIIQGEKGVWNSNDLTIRDYEGNIIWKYDEADAKAKFKNHDMYTLEHVDLVNHIRQGKVLDIAEITFTTAMACMMARESAYSGKIVKWENMVASNLDMMPAEFASGELGKMDLKKYEAVPMPGIPYDVS
jgi:predicted dehydrogenase